MALLKEENLKNIRNEGGALCGAKRPCRMVEYKKYALTVTPNKRDRVYYADDIMEKIDVIRSNHKVIDVQILSYEIKKTGVLHAHCSLVVKNKGFYRYPKFPGWQVYIKPVTCEKGWIRYCRKHAHNRASQNEILIQHHARNNFIFLDTTSSEDE